MNNINENDDDEIKIQYALITLDKSVFYLVEAVEVFICDGSIEVNEVKFNDDKAKYLIVNGEAYSRNPELDIEELKKIIIERLGYGHFYIDKNEITLEHTLRYVELVDIIFTMHYLKPKRVKYNALIKVDSELNFPDQTEYPGWGINISLKYSNLELGENIFKLDYLLNVVSIVNDTSEINIDNWKTYITDLK